MTSLKAPDTNAYDILGVSPDDNAQEIELAFHRLIKEGGYRVGVPLHGQWQRGREIKEAYATLGDPSRRRAYDESLEQTSERPLWPAAHDQPVDPMVQPHGETPDSSAGGFGSGNDEADRAPLAAIDSGDDRILSFADQPSTWSGDDSDRDRARYGSAKLWGSAAATLALGALLYVAWPSAEPQRSGGEAPAGARADSSRAAPAARLASLPPSVAADGATAQPGSEEPGAVPPMPDRLDAFFVAPGPAPTQAEGPVKLALASETQTAGDAAAASGDDAAPVPATSSPGQAAAAAADVATAAAAPTSTGAPPAAQAPGDVSPGPAAAPPQARAAAPARPAASMAGSEPQWISGGPTGADNRRGRYVGNVIVQFTVQPNGRVSGCGAVRGSGNGGLDALTCRLVEERMRFKPALDAQGTPIASTAHARYEWGPRRRKPGLFSSIFR